MSRMPAEEQLLWMLVGIGRGLSVIAFAQMILIMILMRIRKTKVT